MFLRGGMGRVHVLNHSIEDAEFIVGLHGR